MLRAALRLLLIGIVLVTMAGAAAAAPNQQSGAFLPAIVDFTADSATVSYADVEAGKAQVMLSWHTINTSGQYHLALDTYRQSAWVSAIAADEALPLNGSKQVTVTLPQNFGVPAYRLTLKTSMGGMLDQQFLTIPYTPSSGVTPKIVSFTTGTHTIDTNLLVQANTRLVVSWDVQNRQPDTLIRFDQVLPDGSTVAADPPRHSLWLPSQGQGAVIPRPTSSKTDLHFRMSLVNLHDGTVYDQADVTIPVVGSVVMVQAVPQSSNSGSVQAQSVEQPQAEAQAAVASQPNISGDQISTFSAESAAPGGDVTLNWDAGSAQSVELLETANNGPTTLYIQLPPSGSMSLPLPEDSSGVTYTLRARDANGQVSTGEVNVTPADQGSASTTDNGG